MNKLQSGANQDVYSTIFNWSTEINLLYILSRIAMRTHGGESKLSPDESQELDVLLSTIHYQLSDIEDKMNAFLKKL